MPLCGTADKEVHQKQTPQGWEGKQARAAAQGGSWESYRASQPAFHIYENMKRARDFLHEQDRNGRISGIILIGGLLLFLLMKHLEKY